MSVWTAVVIIYGLALFVLSLNSINNAVLTFVFLRRRPALPQPLPAEIDPVVTIQLPLFNELYVAERVIRSACEVDYPAHLLEIQVLDDSTDETLDLTRRLVQDFQSRGVRIVHIHRENRKGFKSGALAEGFKRAHGEFIAVFDADFVVPTDFLRQTLPHFSDSSVGIVQTRWTYMNGDFSELTRAHALALDGHFVIDQTARHSAGWFVSFNGTAGVLRARAIAEAGGWQDDTLCEDVDLSYRAQLAGWRAVYLPDVVCRSEIPSDMHSLKVQQFRWTKGSFETARKLLPRLWPSDLPLAVKCQATLHLLGSVGYPMSIVLTVLSPFMILAAGLHHLKITWPLMVYFQVAFAGTWIYYFTAVRALGGSWVRRLARYPIFLMVFVGGSVSNTRAVLEALLGKRSPFERTPKYNSTSNSAGVISGRYRSKTSWNVVGEFTLAGFALVATVLAVAYRQYVAMPFLMIWGGGYALVALYSLRHWPLESPTIRVLESEPMSQTPVLASVSEQGTAA